MQTAKRPCDCPSVRPSVSGVGGSGPHRFEILDNYQIPSLPGEHGEIWERLEVWWEKVVCWSTKAAISPKWVKIEEKLLRRTYSNSPTLFGTVPFPNPSIAPFPILEIRTSPRTPIAIIPGTGKNTDFKFGRYIYRVHPNKSSLKFWRKGRVGVSENCPNFWVPIISGTSLKLRTSNFVRTFIGSIETKAH